MNNETFQERLSACSTQKDLELLKKAIQVELDELNGKNTDKDPKMKEYIVSNYDKVIQVIFVEPNELDLNPKLIGKVMMKRANGLEKHLKTKMGSFFSTWNGLKLERHERFKRTVEERQELMRELGNKEYREQMAKMKVIEENINEIAW